MALMILGSVFALLAGYAYGRISSVPLGAVEQILRRRLVEWRLWYLDQHIDRASRSKRALLSYHERVGTFAAADDEAHPKLVAHERR